MNQQQLIEQKQQFELKGHTYQIADTGDYDGCWEITNGKVSIFTKDDPDEELLQPIVDALNDSKCKFYLDDAAEFEASMYKQEAERLQGEGERLREQVKAILDQAEERHDQQPTGFTTFVILTCRSILNIENP